MSNPQASLANEDDRFDVPLGDTSTTLPVETGLELLSENSMQDILAAGCGPFTQGVRQWVWNWTTLGLVGSCTTSGIGLAALVTMTSPAAEVICPNLNTQASDRAKLLCLQTAISVTDITTTTVALDWVGRWDHSHPLYNEAQGLLTTWSSTVLQTAEQYQQSGRRSEAIALLGHIPFSSPYYYQAQQFRKQLQQSQPRSVPSQVAPQELATPPDAQGNTVQSQRRQQRVNSLSTVSHRPLHPVYLLPEVHHRPAFTTL